MVQVQWARHRRQGPDRLRELQIRGIEHQERGIERQKITQHRCPEFVRTLFMIGRFSSAQRKQVPDRVRECLGGYAPRRTHVSGQRTAHGRQRSS